MIKRGLFLFFFAISAVAVQAPRIGIIDFYGLHKVPEEKIRRALGAKEGDKLPASKGDTEERLEEISGVVKAQLEATCCIEGNAILYVGIEERGAAHFDVRTAPTGEVMLPEEIHDAYVSFLQAVAAAARRGSTGEDLTKGHSLMADPSSRERQLKFVEIAEQNLALLRKVLRESGDDEHRAISAYVIGYAPDKTKIVNDLQYALQDADSTVRSNALRALGAVMVLSVKQPELGIKISPTWFVEMLNSISWSDRNNAAVSLVNLTEGRDEGVLSQLRERAMPSLTEMAMWKHLPHALPAFILLGRVLGLQEKEIQDMWSSGEREKLLAKTKEMMKKR